MHTIPLKTINRNAHDIYIMPSLPLRREFRCYTCYPKCLILRNVNSKHWVTKKKKKKDVVEHKNETRKVRIANSEQETSVGELKHISTVTNVT